MKYYLCSEYATTYRPKWYNLENEKKQKQKKYIIVGIELFINVSAKRPQI